MTRASSIRVGLVVATAVIGSTAAIPIRAGAVVAPAPVGPRAVPRSPVPVAPGVRTGGAVDVRDTSATITGTYTVLHDETVSFVVWEEGRSERPIVDSRTVSGIGGAVTAVLTDLQPSSTYRYYAMLGETMRGTDGTFRTTASPNDPAGVFPAPSPFTVSPAVVPKRPVYGQGLIRVVDRRVQINSYLLRAKTPTPTCSSAAKVTLRARNLGRPVVRTTRMVTGGAAQCAILELKIQMKGPLRAARAMHVTISGRDIRTFRTIRRVAPGATR